METLQEKALAAVPEQTSVKGGYFNLLEPEALVRAFLSSPPEGFLPFTLGEGNGRFPGFFTRFDLTTTAEKKAKEFLDKIGFLLPRPRTVFVGTTVSEYALFPAGAPTQGLIEQAFKKLRELRAQFIIVKDIPAASPLLTDNENAFSQRLGAELEGRGFVMVEGQALAYVPVDFSTVDEFLQRFSKSRRKDFKRKLRSFDDVQVEAVDTGGPFFTDGAVDELYSMYLNVYDRSYIHFDKLTKPFFREVLRDAANGGVVFIYRDSGRIIGYNLCFRSRGYLVDKYVGFVYPDSTRHNLYFLSWFYNLGYCAKNGLGAFVAGWTDPEIKAYLGARFTHTRHAVYIKNPLLRFMLRRFKGFFESDKKVVESLDRD